MIRFLAAVICVSVLSLASFASVSAAHEGVAKNTCGIKRAYTEQVTRYARVVERTIEDVDEERTRVWACLRVGFGDSRHARRHGYRQRRLVGEVICYPQDTCTYETVVATEWPRTRVAFTEGGCSRYAAYNCGTRVRVVDLRSGQVATTAFETTSGAPSYFDITPTGTAVWLAENPDICESVYPHNCIKRVRGLTFRGEAMVFDEGHDLSDMSLVRNRLYWMRAGEPQTAEVP